ANTGMALRDATPRIALLASGSGGASGYLVDLGYTCRRLLRQMRQPDARVTTLLFCGAPEDPATPAPELANLYATLTEINHYAEGVTAFSAQYGSDGQRQSEQGPPFDAVYVLTQRERSPDARRDVVAAEALDALSPPQALAQQMAGLEEQCWQFGGPDNPASWAASALGRVRDWLGSGIQAGAGTLTVGPGNRKSRLNRALENACS